MFSEAIRRVACVITILALSAFAAAQNPNSAPTDFNEATIQQLESMMANGSLTSHQLVQFYLHRIFALDQNGVNSIIQLNPNALAQASDADAKRRAGSHLPLLGIPVLLKDNIDTGPALGMATTAGSLALCFENQCAPAPFNSTIAQNLINAGAIILGKTNLSEWANFRSFFSTSGWSGRGGLTHNPYSLDRNACGSSSGSGAAASSNFATVSFGSETDGSIVCPASINGVVGIKPTIGLVSRSRVVPISHNQDTVGPHARTVADAAMALNAVISRTPDPGDPYTGGVPLGWEACANATGVACDPGHPRAGKSRPNLSTIDYTKFLDPNGLADIHEGGARLGMTRSGVTNDPPQVQAGFFDAINAIGAAGAQILDLDDGGCVDATGAALTNCTNISPAVNLFANNGGNGETVVLLYDFKNDLAAYLAPRSGVPIGGGTLQDAINFDNAHSDLEMPYFGQEEFLAAQAFTTTDPNLCQTGFSPPCTYNDALKDDQQLGVNIDNALSTYHLDSLVAPTDSPAWTTDLVLSDHFTFASSGIAGSPGYPIINVPAAKVLGLAPPGPNDTGLPMGISFIGTAFSEPTLITLASGFEGVTHVRFQPTFVGDITKMFTAGTTLVRPPKTVPKKPPHRM
ncbi:MAG TPA: amidase family protein [Terriglobales bacterium]|nr:amidase family protein [Terriglobales bacterium]